MKLLKASIGCFVGSALLFSACGVEPASICDAPLTCNGSSAEGGTETGLEGGADVVQPPAGCDAAAEPKDAPKCVVSDFGVFVDATNGADANAGTKEAPVKSITAALGKLGGKARVYVCEGTYAEHVKLTSAVSLYGGFACSGWTYSGTKAKVAPSDVGYALEVVGLSAPAIIADVSFTAMAGTDVSPSSIAAFVKNTSSLKLLRVGLEAGTGFSGNTPTKAATLALMTSMPTAASLNGNVGDANNGGAAQLCTCVGGGTSKGGAGGPKNGDGSDGTMAQAVNDPVTATGLRSTSAECIGSGQSGRFGSNAPGAASAAGAVALGTLTETGWSAESGKDGSLGGTGQGGGGGGGAANGGGGSGGCGGCGGEGGKGGGGGGASVALLAFNSPVALTGSTLTAASAGAGGAGGAGGDGGTGGDKGNGSGSGCGGGKGGSGGNGGSGGGGAGGVSVGVLYKAPIPTLATSQVTTGALGAKGTGPGSPGIDGEKADTLEAK